MMTLLKGFPCLLCILQRTRMSQALAAIVYIAEFNELTPTNESLNFSLRNLRVRLNANDSRNLTLFQRWQTEH